jgi:hypothetical protein
MAHRQDDPEKKTPFFKDRNVQVLVTALAIGLIILAFLLWGQGII